MAKPHKSPLKLIYIAGYGRSGTTLLDIALGQQPGVFATGELTALPRHVWSEREYCACRLRADECRFWKPVVAAWMNARPPDGMDSYRRTVARSEWLFDPRRLFWRFMPGKDARSYHDDTLRLLREIAGASGASIIVDSSKLPGRASALMSIREIEVFVVHMVRDGRGVAWSMMKPYQRLVEAGIQKELKPKPLWYTAVRWLMVNLGAEMLRARLPRERSIRVRYEDFVADPQGTVKSILEIVGHGYALPDHLAGVIRPQHQIAGSRHRMQEEITIQKDSSWTSQMPKSLQTLFAILTSPLLFRYGYFGSASAQGKTPRSEEPRITEEAA